MYEWLVMWLAMAFLSWFTLVISLATSFPLIVTIKILFFIEKVILFSLLHYFFFVHNGLIVILWWKLEIIDMENNFAWLNHIYDNTLKHEGWYDDKVIYFNYHKAVMSASPDIEYINAVILWE